MTGWDAPTLRFEGEWRIYSDSGVAFVLLEKACDSLIEACPGAREQLIIEDNKPF